MLNVNLQSGMKSNTRTDTVRLGKGGFVVIQGKLKTGAPGSILNASGAVTLNPLTKGECQPGNVTVPVQLNSLYFTAIGGPIFADPNCPPVEGQQVKVGKGKWLETEPKPLRSASADGCTATVPQEGYAVCNLGDFDLGDSSPPTITYSLSPEPTHYDSRGNPWLNAQDLLSESTVTATFACTDPDDTPEVSDVKTCPRALPITNVGEGANQTFMSGPASDLLGNTSTTNVVLNIDKTAPLIDQPSVSPQPNNFGWNNTSPVAVAFPMPVDNLSGVNETLTRIDIDGIRTSAISGNVSGDGTHTISLIAVDIAGNIYTFNPPWVVKIDTKSPVVAITTPTNGEGFHTLTIDVSLTADDVTSGVNNNQVQCKADSGHGPAYYTAASAGGDQYKCQGIALAQGNTTITAIANDNAGNQGVSSAVVVSCPTCPPQ
jgi:hypothetical protein